MFYHLNTICIKSGFLEGTGITVPPVSAVTPHQTITIKIKMSKENGAFHEKAKKDAT